MVGEIDIRLAVDGRRDDTPPGGALIFEVWQQPKRGDYLVRTYFTAQTLDQMRSSTPLTLANPSERVPVFIPGCSLADLSCTLTAFSNTIQRTIDRHAVIEK